MSSVEVLASDSDNDGQPEMARLARTTSLLYISISGCRLLSQLFLHTYWACCGQKPRDCRWNFEHDCRTWDNIFVFFGCHSTISGIDHGMDRLRTIFFKLENYRFADAVTSVSSRYIRISGLGCRIVVSGCPSVSFWFQNTREALQAEKQKWALRNWRGTGRWKSSTGCKHQNTCTLTKKCDVFTECKTFGR